MHLHCIEAHRDALQETFMLWKLITRPSIHSEVTELANRPVSAYKNNGQLLCEVCVWKCCICV